MVVLNNTADEETVVTMGSKSPHKAQQSLVKQKSEGSLASRPAFSFSSSKTSMYDTFTSLSMKREDGVSGEQDLQRKRVPKMSKGSRKLIGYELLPKKKLVLGNGGSGTISASNGVGGGGGGPSSSSSSNNSIGMVKAKQPKIVSGNLDDDDDDEGYDIVYDSTKEDGIALPMVPNNGTTLVTPVNVHAGVVGNNVQSYYSDSITSINNGNTNTGLR